MNTPRDITDYLRQSVELGGSDLHLSAWAPPAARIDHLTPWRRRPAAQSR